MSAEHPRASSIELPGVQPATMRAVQKMAAQCQTLIDGSDEVWVAWPVKTGLGSHRLVLLSWFTQVLLIFQKFRVVAITEDRMLVFAAGWFRRTTPRRLLRVLPRETPLVVGRGGALQLGPENVRVERHYLPVVIAAAAGNGAT